MITKQSDSYEVSYREYIDAKQYNNALQLLYDIQHPKLSLIFPRLPMSDSVRKNNNYPKVTTDELNLLVAYVRKQRIISWTICVSMISIGSVVVVSAIITAILFIVVDRAYLYLLCLNVAFMIPASILLYLGYWGLSADFSLVHYGVVADKRKKVDIN